MTFLDSIRSAALAATAILALALPAFADEPPADGPTTPAPAPAPTGAEDGPHATLTLDFPDLTDADRGGRRVPLKVHYPRAAGPWPLVILSHGGAGNRDAFLYQARHLASHGYVAVCTEHVFSNTERVRWLSRRSRAIGVKAKVHEALLQIVADPRSVLERPRDVSFAIDRATEWTADGGPLAGRIDVSKVAVIGHSYGAYTTLVACGAQPILDHLDPPVSPGAAGLAGDLSDPRITIGVAMSPQGTGTSRFSKESFATIDRPLLCLSGSEDHQLGADGSTQPAEVRLEAFELMPEGDKTFVWLQNADHLAFADNPKAHLLPSRSRPDVQRITKALTLAFCDVHLKASDPARARFTEAHARSLCGEVVTGLRWLTK